MQNNENIIDDIKVKKKKKSKKGNSRKSNILLMFIFFIGFSILMYPFITQWYYRVESGKKIEKFEDVILQKPITLLLMLQNYPTLIQMKKRRKELQSMRECYKLESL